MIVSGLMNLGLLYDIAAPRLYSRKRATLNRDAYYISRGNQGYRRHHHPCPGSRAHIHRPRGDIMVLMAISSVGGMAVVLVTVFLVLVLYCTVEEVKLRMSRTVGLEVASNREVRT